MKTKTKKKAKKKKAKKTKTRKQSTAKEPKDSRPVIGQMVRRRIPRSQIKDAPYNPRVPLEPGDGEWENLKASLLAFDQVLPLVWNMKTGNLVGGHQTLRVIDAEFTVKGGRLDVSVVNLTLAKEKALNIALNKIDGWWDPDKLAAALADIRVSNVSEILTGFDEAEIDKMIGEFIQQELEDPNKEEPGPDVKLDDRGSSVSLQLGPDVIRQLDAESKKNESSRAGVARTIVELWAKRRIKKAGVKRSRKRNKD